MSIDVKLLLNDKTLLQKKLSEYEQTKVLKDLKITELTKELKLVS